MKRPGSAPQAAAGKPRSLKSLSELAAVRIAREQRAASAHGGHAGAPSALAAEARGAPARSAEVAEFREAVRDVKPLPAATARPHRPGGPGARPHPVQRERDNRAVLDESLGESIGIESLLETDESLSYRRVGISADTLRKLRRGFWVVQGELDLHGHRVTEAHHALTDFLREALRRGSRCVRIVHGKGHGSRDGVPVLKGKVRSWLARRSDVIAFCQARPADGGAGALLVLLKP